MYEESNFVVGTYFSGVPFSKMAATRTHRPTLYFILTHHTFKLWKNLVNNQI